MLKTNNLSADNFKKPCNLNGSKPEPAIRSCDTGQHIPCQLTTRRMCNIRSQAPTLAKQFKISHWLPSVADGRVDGRTGGQTHVRSPDYQNFSDERLPNFLNYGVLLEHGAPLLVILVLYHLHKIKLAPTIKCLIDQSPDKMESVPGPAIRPFNVIQVSRCPILNTDNRPLGRS